MQRPNIRPEPSRTAHRCLAPPPPPTEEQQPEEQNSGKNRKSEGHDEATVRPQPASPLARRLRPWLARLSPAGWARPAPPGRSWLLGVPGLSGLAAGSASAPASPAKQVANGLAQLQTRQAGPEERPSESEGHEEAQAEQREEDSGEAPMDSAHFRRYARVLVDYVSEYLETIGERRVTPVDIEPGYLAARIGARVPERGEPFGRIMSDFEKHIMCGITHWQHPHFHAYFPAGNAYPSILADMLGDALGCQGFSWAASPAYTELEVLMLDWVGRLIGLPEQFLCQAGSEQPGSRGGGVIQGSASECVLVSLLAARHAALDRLRAQHPNQSDCQLLARLTAYCSREAHSCVEKAAMIGFVRMRALDTDHLHSLRGPSLEAAIAQDCAAGLEPFLVCATLGTTSCCSFDRLDELGPICAAHQLWLHVDAAYAGSAFICPEFRHLLSGVHWAHSFNMNPNKWLLVNFDCSLLWVKDRFRLTRAFVVDPVYLQHSYSDQAIDYRHWGIPLSRRFRALKLWFVLRNYGVQGLQAYIRNHVRLARLFARLLAQDARFSVCNQVQLGLVCFRLRGSNALNQRLLSAINASGLLHMVPASLKGSFVIRFCVCHPRASQQDMHYALKIIGQHARQLLMAPAPAATPPAHAAPDEPALAPEPREAAAEQQVRPDEADDQVCRLAERRKRMSLRYKREFFVRMVSDPRVYRASISADVLNNGRPNTGSLGNQADPDTPPDAPGPPPDAPS